MMKQNDMLENHYQGKDIKIHEMHLQSKDKNQCNSENKFVVSSDEKIKKKYQQSKESVHQNNDCSQGKILFQNENIRQKQGNDNQMINQINEEKEEAGQNRVIGVIAPMYWQFPEQTCKYLPFEQRQFGKTSWKAFQMRSLNPITDLSIKVQVKYNETNIKQLQKYICGQLVGLKQRLKIHEIPEQYFLGVIMSIGALICLVLLCLFLIMYIKIQLTSSFANLAWIIYFAGLTAFVYFIIQFLRWKIKQNLKLDYEFQKFSDSLIDEASKDGKFQGLKLFNRGIVEEYSKPKHSVLESAKEISDVQIQKAAIIIPIRLKLKRSYQSKHKWIQILFSQSAATIEVFLSSESLWKVPNKKNISKIQHINKQDALNIKQLRARQVSDAELAKQGHIL